MYVLADSSHKGNILAEKSDFILDLDPSFKSNLAQHYSDELYFKSFPG
jgi:hypothetical protein